MLTKQILGNGMEGLAEAFLKVVANTNKTTLPPYNEQCRCCDQNHRSDDFLKCRPAEGRKRRL